jgi:hypothetical protein
VIYNIKRSVNLKGVSDLIDKLKKWNFPYKAKALFVGIGLAPYQSYYLIFSITNVTK